MDIIEFIIASFAVYRLSRMLATERGAFNLFENWRKFIYDKFGEESWVTDGVTCPLCVSFWVALLVSLWWWFGWATSQNSIADFILLWLGLSGVATFLYKSER